MPEHIVQFENWLTHLRHQGWRITAVQAVLVQILAQTAKPLSAEQVWELACQSRPATGRATVYRLVEKLESLGLLRRVHGYRGCTHFLPAYSETYLLFICVGCGQVDYLERQPLTELVQQLAEHSGHQITDSRLQLFGTCATCQKNTHPATRS
jgi:Fur family ferric uptake transcriptional regulator